MASGQMLSTASCRFFLTFVCVQVLIRYQCQCQTINVALNKTVTMASTTNYRFLWEGSFAVDGDLRTTPSTCDCCSSIDMSTDPIWFTLDLWEQYSINSIVIMGRSAGSNGRLRQLQVYIRNTTDWTGNPDYNHGTASQVINYTLPEAKTAQYVTLVQERYDFIIICEIQVFKQDCIIGFYGNTCTPCPVSCLTDTCSQTNGTCLDGCKVGKYGSHCSANCPPHCKDNVCDQVSGFCTDGCSEGKYGNTCSSECPGGCRDALCEQNSGNCTNGCVNGSYGDRCALPCPDSCQESVCDQTGGICTHGCRPGKYGDKCTLDCSENCRNSVCHQTTGDCIDGCVTGKYGNNCSLDCPDNCQYSVCNQSQGECTRGCLPGKHGMKCSLNCSANCNQSVCAQESGYCTGGCVASKHGDSCSLSCPENCKDSLCDQQSGYCTRGCVAGMYSNNCSLDCPKDCQNSVCDKETGDCTDGCVEGKFGNKCLEDCPENCEEKVCNQTTGYCVLGCMAGKHGNICSFDCPVDCQDTVCDQKTGVCSNGCVTGKFGTMCSATCPAHCKDLLCDKQLGICTKGCEAGFRNQNCTEECEDGKHGLNCSSDCGNCATSPCSKVDGSCQEGCSEGWTGLHCTAEKVQGVFPVGPAVGGGAGAAVVVAVVIIVIVVLRRRRRGNDKEINDLKAETAVKIGTFDDHAVGEEDNSTYANWTIKKANGILIHDLYDIILAKLENDGEGFVTEFDTLRKGLTQSHSVAIRPENKGKNRYKGMIAYDETRVILRATNDAQTDYINACYINGYEKVKKFIASQGPTNEMVDDFWQMVWQENSDIIVMLTNLVEMGTIKCIQYWPTEGRVSYRDITVTLAKAQSFGDYCIRRLEVQKKGEAVRIVNHYHFMAWPDKGVPDSAWSLVNFWKAVTVNDSQRTTPYIVHCSAGVGRTGTFIALDCANSQAHEEGCVDVLRCVETLRRQRVLMVQTKGQYVYLYEALAESLNFGILPQLTSQYIEWYNQMLEEDTQSHGSGLEKQHRLLLRSHGLQGDTPALLHNEIERKCGKGTMVTQFVTDWNGKKVFIVTESPRSNTMNTFWQTVDKHNVKNIVMLTDKSSPSYEIAQSLGANDKRISKQFAITVSQTEVLESFTVRTIEYESPSKKQQVSVKQFEFSAWNSSDAPTSIKSMVNFLDYIQSCHPRLVETSPILLHSNGRSQRCGLVCLLQSEVQRIKMDGMVNILRSAKTMKSENGQPYFVPSYVQYKCCHDVILEHLTQSSMYQNVSL